MTQAILLGILEEKVFVITELLFVGTLKRISEIRDSKTDNPWLSRCLNREVVFCLILSGLFPHNLR